MSTDVWTTADLSDAHPTGVRVLPGAFDDFGGVEKFFGAVATLQVFEDYRPVLLALQEPGAGRVLLVDAGGSLDRAVLGERLLNTAAKNGWAGVVIHGAVRDTALTRQVPIGLRARGSIPQRGESGGAAVAGEPITITHVTIVPGEMLWADQDGIVVGTASDE